MSKEAEEAFEKGKQLLESNNASEAISALAKAIRLDSTNAEYRAWLAQAWNAEKNYDGATIEASRAIELNPNCTKAYRQLGFAQFCGQKYSESLKSYSKAIEVEPNSPHAYHLRSQVHYALKNFENAIIDQAQYFELESYDTKSIVYSELGGKFESWYQIIDKHLTNTVWPQLEANGERYVMHWPCHLIWDKKLKVTKSRHENYLYHGRGYIFLTNKNIRLFCLAQIDSKFSIYREFGESIIGIQLNSGFSQQVRADKSWVIPYSMVNGVLITEDAFGPDAIRLVTTAMTWEICQHFEDSLASIFAGINVDMSGKFINKSSMRGSQENTTSEENVISLLKKLGVLKTQGIISEADFEQKKRELLARL